MNDGVIKFNIRSWEKTTSLSDILYKEIECARKKLFELELIGEYHELKLGYGNISKRLDKNIFLITGSQTGCYPNLDGKFYTTITDWDFSNNSVVCQGPIEPSSESLTHAAFYSANHFINCVIHIHDKILWLNMIKNGFVSTPAKADYGSIELYNSIFSIIKDVNFNEPITIVMKGHEDGILFAGHNITETLDRVIEIHNHFKK